jgi:hypothetical protein
MIRRFGSQGISIGFNPCRVEGRSNGPYTAWFAATNLQIRRALQSPQDNTDKQFTENSQEIGR